MEKCSSSILIKKYWLDMKCIGNACILLVVINKMTGFSEFLKYNIYLTGMYSSYQISVWDPAASVFGCVFNV